MDLSTFVVAVFCLIDDRLKDLRVRQRGPPPEISDSEVLTIEIVGEFLGIDTDKGIHLFFRRHYAEWFPALGAVHRTTFARQAANLWKAKERLWQEFLALAPHDPTFALIDSMPLPACLFARAYGCKRFRGEAAFGKDTLLRQTFYGFRMHVRVCRPGVITGFSVAPADAHELSIVPDLVESTCGVAVGDRNYWSPEIEEEPERGTGVELLAPYRSKKRDPAPQRSAYLGRLRYRIDTVFSQLTGRLLHKAGVGQGPPALGRAAAEEGLESHRRFPAQPSAGQPTSATLSAPSLETRTSGQLISSQAILLRPPRGRGPSR